MGNTSARYVQKGSSLASAAQRGAVSKDHPLHVKKWNAGPPPVRRMCALAKRAALGTLTKAGKKRAFMKYLGEQGYAWRFGMVGLSDEELAKRGQLHLPSIHVRMSRAYRDEVLVRFIEQYALDDSMATRGKQFTHSSGQMRGSNYGTNAWSFLYQ